MSDRKPQTGDRVRWTSVVEGRCEYVDDKTIYIDDGGDDPDGNVNVLSMGGATVEVLEPADDPSKDPLGTLRREERDGGFALYVHGGGSDTGGSAWVVIYTSEPGILGDRMDHPFVAEFPVVGAVPGTPAAEQTPSAEQVAQWETDDLELAVDPHEPVVVVRAETAPARVFSSDGPEPPADVQCVEWMFDTRSTVNFLQRHGDGWAWVSTPGATPEFSLTPLHWCPARGDFREVIS